MTKLLNALMKIVSTLGSSRISLQHLKKKTIAMGKANISYRRFDLGGIMLTSAVRVEYDSLNQFSSQV